jgi:hypothetical protein
MIFWVEPLGAVFYCPGQKRPKRAVVVRLGQAVEDALNEFKKRGGPVIRYSLHTGLLNNYIFFYI